jgi:hypothetical protein
MGETRRSDVVFFLGAGASVPAGLPNTRELAERFLAQRDETVDAARKLAEVIKRMPSADQFDVEMLLAVLEGLGPASTDPLAPALRSSMGVTEESVEDAAISLRTFIREALAVETGRTMFLQPLRGFLQDGSIDIITVNYDTCVEQFCDASHIPCDDGFDSEWNPSRFDRESVGVRLYKLHGSVLWYYTGRGPYIKLPIRTPSPVTLYTGETAQNLMSYPAQKLGLEEPFLDMLGRVKHILADETTRFLVVVGYSFRDDHITRLILDAAARNRNLTVLLVDPEAGSISKKRLVFLGRAEQRVATYIRNRVVCLPYKFEKLFPFLKSHYLEHLRKGLYAEQQQGEAVIAGRPSDWGSVYPHLAEAEAAQKTLLLLNQQGWRTRGEHRLARARVDILLALNLELQGLPTRARHPLRHFYITLRSVVADGAWVTFSRKPYIVSFYVGYEPTERGLSAAVDMKELLTRVSDMLAYLESRVKWATRESPPIARAIQLLRELRSYAQDGSEGLDASEYLKERSAYDKSVAKYEGTLREEPDAPAWSEMERQVPSVERRVLRTLFEKYADLGAAPPQS